jgi:hypothetical protein
MTSALSGCRFDAPIDACYEIEGLHVIGRSDSVSETTVLDIDSPTFIVTTGTGTHSAAEHYNFVIYLLPSLRRPVSCRGQFPTNTVPKARSVTLYALSNKSLEGIGPFASATLRFR